MDDARRAVEADVKDSEVKEEDVVWREEEVEREMNDDEEEVEEQKEWRDADCRVIVNVRLTQWR